jgi:hypothetical protein
MAHTSRSRRVLAWWHALACGAAAQSLTVANLTVEMVSRPLGIAPDRPRFGWIPAGSPQASYRIVVSAAPSMAVVSWDSGVVASDASQQVTPPPPPLPQVR